MMFSNYSHQVQGKKYIYNIYAYIFQWGAEIASEQLIKELGPVVNNR